MQGLAALEDSGVRRKALPRAYGPAVVGTGGVQAAQAQRIAFLDDDDGRFSRKFDIQLRTAQWSPFLNSVVSSSGAKRPMSCCSGDCRCRVRIYSAARISSEEKGSCNPPGLESPPVLFGSQLVEQAWEKVAMRL